MSLTNDDDSKPTTTPSRLIPILPDGTDITWNENDATILATLNSIGKWVKRTNTHESLIEDRAVLVKGKIYIDSPEALNFMISDTLTDDRDIMSPSPPSRQRLKDALDNAEEEGDDRKKLEAAAITKVPDEVKHDFIVNPMVIKQALAELLTTLLHVFGSADWAEDISDAVAGDGTLFLAHSSSGATTPQSRTRPQRSRTSRRSSATASRAS